MSEKQPFIYLSGRFATRLSVSYNPTHADGTLDMLPYRLDLGVGSLSLSDENALTVVLELLVALYGHDGITMEAAERIAYLAQSVLVDGQADHA